MSKKSIKVLASSAVALLAVALACAWLVWGDYGSRPVVETLGPDGPRSAGTVVERKTANPEPKQTPKRMHVAGAHELRYAMMAAVDAARSAEVGLKGSLEVAAEQLDGDQVWLPLRLTGATVEQNTAAVAMGGPLDRAQLQLPWLARVEDDGRVSEVRFAASVSTSAQALLSSITLAIQFSRPSATSATWQIEERELNGVYLARYQRASDGSVTKERKSEAGKWPALVATSRYAFAGPRIASVAVREEGKFPIGSLVSNVQTRDYHVDLQLTRTGDVDGHWAKGLSPAQMLAFAPQMHNASDDRPTRPLAAVIADVKTIRGEVKTHDFKALRDEMARALRDDPTAVAEVEQQLSRRALRGDAMLVAVAGLVSARSDAALEATARMVANAALNQELRVQLLHAATQLDVAPPVLADATRDLMVAVPEAGLGAAAASTLGALTAAMRNRGDHDAAKSYLAKMASLGARIVAPATFGEEGDTEAKLAVRVGWISGFGNAGHPGFAPILLAALNESDELVRAHAAYALRYQNPAPLLEVMVEVMAKEESAMVRDYLVSAMRLMGPAVTLPLVEKALRTDRSKMVRLTAAYVLAGWMSGAPGVRKVLEDAQPVEKDAHVALAIAEYLKPGTSLGLATKSEYDPEAHPLSALEEAP